MNYASPLDTFFSRFEKKIGEETDCTQVFDFVLLFLFFLLNFFLREKLVCQVKLKTDVCILIAREHNMLSLVALSTHLS